MISIHIAFLAFIGVIALWFFGFYITHKLAQAIDVDHGSIWDEEGEIIFFLFLFWILILIYFVFYFLFISFTAPFKLRELEVEIEKLKEEQEKYVLKKSRGKRK